MKKICFILLFLLIAAASSAFAQSPLTGDQIERVIKTMNELEPQIEKLDKEMKQHNEKASEVMDPMVFQKECTRIWRYNQETKAIIESNGFDEDSWAQTAGRTLKAFVAVIMEQEHDLNSEEMKAAFAKIENNPDMNPEQKKMIKIQMQTAMTKAMEMMKAPKEDMEAVRPYLDELEKTFEAS